MNVDYCLQTVNIVLCYYLCLPSASVHTLFLISTEIDQCAYMLALSCWGSLSFKHRVNNCRSGVSNVWSKWGFNLFILNKSKLIRWKNHKKHITVIPVSITYEYHTNALVNHGRYISNNTLMGLCAVKCIT